MEKNTMEDKNGFYGEFLSNLRNKDLKEPDYSLVDQLVDKYQAGDKDSAEELINQMSPYMIKYFKIIKFGIIDLNDRDSRRFISLFVDSFDARERLKRKFQSKDARCEAYQAVSFLQSTCANIPTEDVIQELIMILLTLAKRFSRHREKVNFCGYLYNSFRFELARRIKVMTSDPLVHRSELNLSFDDDEYLNEEEIDEELSYTNEPMMYLEEDLGNSWQRGLTCSEMFSDLTQQQRIILKLYYVDGESDTSIGDRLGIHRTTVKTQRMKAKEILKLKDDPNAEEETDNNEDD
jgi:RNA polymerase sigma factor (sigma-70 family)